MSKIIQFQIDSNFYYNVVNVCDKEITNCPCKIHINENEIEVPLILALSSLTCLTSEIMSDVTLKEFTINIDFKYKPDNTFFDKLVDLLYSRKVSLTEEEVVNLACFGEGVNNRYFLIPYEEHVKSLEDTLTINNCFELLHKKHEFHLEVCKCTKEIELISSNFESQKDNIISISKDITYLPVISAILANENLKLQNEDSLLKFVLKLCTIDREYETLFEYVFIEYCNVETIKLFVKYVDDNVDTTQHIRSIIRCMTRHLIAPNIPMSPNYIEKRHAQHTIKVTDSNSPFGILHREYQRENVVMSCSSTHSGYFYDLIKADVNSDFFTGNSSNSWIQASLKDDKPFILNKYMIRGNKYEGSNNHHLRSWKLEGKKASNNEWIVLDTHDNEPFDKLVTKVFTVSCSEKLNAVKLTQTNTDTTNYNHLRINAFDIFGEYEE